MVLNRFRTLNLYERFSMSSSKVERTCPICNKKFLVWPHMLLRGRGKCCSIQCRNRFNGQNFLEPIEVRFWRHVDKGSGTMKECWLWTASKKKGGYGQLTNHKNKSLLAHRVSWTIHCGPIPDGLDVLHDCPTGDNPSCVNPSHLWLGTNGDNNRDRQAKGRGNAQRGEGHGISKLTNEQVIRIREKYATGQFTQKELGLQEGVTQTVVGSIVRRVAWTHI